MHHLLIFGVIGDIQQDDDGGVLEGLSLQGMTQHTIVASISRARHLAEHVAGVLSCDVLRQMPCIVIIKSHHQLGASEYSAAVDVCGVLPPLSNAHFLLSRVCCCAALLAV